MEGELSPERLPFRRMVAARADNLTDLSRALRGIVGLLGPQPLGIVSSAPPKVGAVREARPVFQETWRERAGPEPTHIALSPGSLAGASSSNNVWRQHWETMEGNRLPAPSQHRRICGQSGARSIVPAWVTPPQVGF
ncbi:hypothetical protein CapIbe_011428 [Capra ibex]